MDLFRVTRSVGFRCVPVRAIHDMREVSSNTFMNAYWRNICGRDIKRLCSASILWHDVALINEGNKRIIFKTLIRRTQQTSLFSRLLWKR